MHPDRTRRTGCGALAARAALSLAVLALTGCAGALMRLAPAAVSATPETAVVTFLPASAENSSVPVELWAGTNLIAMLGSTYRVDCVLPPGAHMLMAKGESWSCVKATVAAGRQYTVMAKFSVATFRSDVALEPVTQADYADPDTLRRIEIALRKLPAHVGNAKPLAKRARTKVREARDALNALKSGKMPFKTLDYGDARP